ncbi:cytochrome c [Stella humosa]|uniref:Cytochrome c n=1 Tax=Stella humosa TaxID=94 RepID=A0A3N1MB98_9PROT|nr:c-type cytochrome [Stella humosa]ROQ00040.1 cytochrome c [Stella humosa]BBK30728.1 hypothetical protein STHU_13620 [Stella humosa]
MKRTACLVGAACIGLALLPVAPPAAAQGSAKAGAALAQKHCASCHSIAGTGPSPNPSARPFRGITKDWPADAIAEALAEGIRIGHGAKPMVDVDFTIEEIADLVAYLASVQR